MRSVVVVLPASICAMMPILRQRSKGTVLDTGFFLSSLRCSCSPTMLTGLLKPSPSIVLLPPGKRQQSPLPAIVREGLVGLGHAVHILFLLNSRPATVGGIEQLIAQL